MICCTVDDLREYGKALKFPVVVEYNNGMKSKVLKRKNFKKFIQKADGKKPKNIVQLSLF
jgi:hypothetical protein